MSMDEWNDACLTKRYNFENVAFQWSPYKDKNFHGGGTRDLWRHYINTAAILNDDTIFISSAFI